VPARSCCSSYSSVCNDSIVRQCTLTRDDIDCTTICVVNSSSSSYTLCSTPQLLKHYHVQTYSLELCFLHYGCIPCTLYRTLAEQMGGSISFTDNVPHGTVMLLRIPKQPPPVAPAAPATTAGTTDAAAATGSDTTAGAAVDDGDSDSSDEQLQLSPAAAADNEALLRTKRILVMLLYCILLILLCVIVQTAVTCVRRHCNCMLQSSSMSNTIAGSHTAYTNRRGVRLLNHDQ
jgi:hypothetical protein